jgi:hypothetical protein
MHARHARARNFLRIESIESKKRANAKLLDHTDQQASINHDIER